MSGSAFWETVLEPGEELLWAGRPKPRLHWRNWPLYGAAPMAAAGLAAAALGIVLTYGPSREMWFLAACGILVLIPLRATRAQLRTYAATRYALTNRRALFFRIDNDQTRAKAYPHSTMTAPQTLNTAPESVRFLSAGSGKMLGFDYVETAPELLEKLEKVGE